MVMKRTDELKTPPAIDPAEHAVESRFLARHVYYLVEFQEHHYAWIKCEGMPDRVYQLPTEDAAREVLRGDQARLLLTSALNERAASVVILGPGSQPKLIYQAAVVNAEGAGIWLAASDTVTGRSRHVLTQFANLGEAMAAFAWQAEQTANEIERTQLDDYPDVLAAVLRYRAAAARADASRARLGDQLRSNEARLRSERAVSQLAHRIDVSRGFLHRVLADEEWTWPAATISADVMREEGEGLKVGGRTWSVRARLSIDADNEQQARMVVEDVLAHLDLNVCGTPALVTPSTAGRFWKSETELDLSALSVIQPDDAVTRFKYVVRNLNGATLTSSGQPDEDRGLWEWLPDRWEMANHSEVFVNPAVRAASICVTANP